MPILEPQSSIVIDQDGVPRMLANLERPVGLVSAWPVFGTVPQAPMIPRDRWDGLIGDDTGPEDQFLGPTLDQGEIGECNAAATVSSMERTRNRQGEAEYVALSAADLYKRINGGRDQGSFLEDGLKESMRTGIARADIVPFTDWEGNYPGALEDRKNFRVLEAFLCPTFGHCMSAVLSGFDLISGIPWYDTYMRVDSDGWLPQPGGKAGGHAIHGYKPTLRKRQSGKEYGIWHKNSWTNRWGFKGCMVLAERTYSKSVGGWWCVRATTSLSGTIPAPQS